MTSLRLLLCALPVLVLGPRPWSTVQEAATPCAKLSERETEDHVRTIFWRGQQGATPYAIADIFAITGGLAIHIRSALPFLRALPPDWFPHVTAQLNGFLASVRVDGARLLPSIKTPPDSAR